MAPYCCCSLLRLDEYVTVFFADKRASRVAPLHGQAIGRACGYWFCAEDSVRTVAPLNTAHWTCGNDICYSFGESRSLYNPWRQKNGLKEQSIIATCGNILSDGGWYSIDILPFTFPILFHEIFMSFSLDILIFQWLFRSLMHLSCLNSSFWLVSTSFLQLIHHFIYIRRLCSACRTCYDNYMLRWNSMYNCQNPLWKSFLLLSGLVWC